VVGRSAGAYEKYKIIYLGQTAFGFPELVGKKHPWTGKYIGTFFLFEFSSFESHEPGRCAPGLDPYPRNGTGCRQPCEIILPQNKIF